MGKLEAEVEQAGSCVIALQETAKSAEQRAHDLIDPDVAALEKDVERVEEINTRIDERERRNAAVARLDEIGGPQSHCNYPWGWAQAGNTPLKRYKQNTHGGGVRDPLIVHWPRRVRELGGIRAQFHHVIDLVPTVLELR